MKYISVEWLWTIKYLFNTFGDRFLMNDENYAYQFLFFNALIF